MIKEWIKRPISLGVIASLATALLVSGTQYLLSRYLPDAILSAFIATASTLFVILIFVQLQIIDPFRLLGRRYLNKTTGIIQVYSSLEESFDDLKSHFRTAKRIDFLIYIGRQEFGIKDALFTDLLSQRVKEQADLEVRILHANENSRHFSERRAKSLGKRRDKWVGDIVYVREQIKFASANSPNVQIYKHEEPFVWRIFVFDDVMFVSGYLHTTKNDKKAPVYKIREGESSLYQAFKNYYNHLWVVYAVDAQQGGPPEGHSSGVPSLAAARRV